MGYNYIKILWLMLVMFFFAYSMLLSYLLSIAKHQNKTCPSKVFWMIVAPHSLPHRKLGSPKLTDRSWRSAAKIEDTTKVNLKSKKDFRSLGPEWNILNDSKCIYRCFWFWGMGSSTIYQTCLSWSVVSIKCVHNSSFQQLPKPVRHA